MQDSRKKNLLTLVLFVGAVFWAAPFLYLFAVTLFMRIELRSGIYWKNGQTMPLMMSIGEHLILWLPFVAIGLLPAYLVWRKLIKS